MHVFEKFDVDNVCAHDDHRRPTASVAERVRGLRTMVILDSAHETDHVLAELERHDVVQHDTGMFGATFNPNGYLLRTL